MKPPHSPPDELSRQRDLIVSPGLSVHLYGTLVGIYGNCIDAGQGFVELPAADLISILQFFNEHKHLLDDAQAPG